MITRIWVVMITMTMMIIIMMMMIMMMMMMMVPIVMTLVGIVTDVSFEQSLKAESPKGKNKVKLGLGLV